MADILTEVENEKNANDALGSMARAVNANSRAVSLLGARAIALSKFLEAVLPQLTATQRTAAIMPFRCGVEDAMSHMDNVVLPAEFHSALLEITNTILAGLGAATVVGRSHAITNHAQTIKR
jgi:hypothetical protein